LLTQEAAAKPVTVKLEKVLGAKGPDVWGEGVRLKDASLI